MHKRTRLSLEGSQIADALATLRDAIAADWNDFAHMQKDSGLSVLRDLPEFKAPVPGTLKSRGPSELRHAPMRRQRRIGMNIAAFGHAGCDTNGITTVTLAFLVVVRQNVNVKGKPSKEP